MKLHDEDHWEVKVRIVRLNRFLMGAFVLLMLSAGPAFGQNFTPSIQQGMGDVNNDRATNMAVMGGYLYVGVNNDPTGVEVWRVSIQGVGLGNDWVQGYSTRMLRRHSQLPPSHSDRQRAITQP